MTRNLSTLAARRPPRRARRAWRCWPAGCSNGQLVDAGGERGQGGLAFVLLDGLLLAVLRGAVLHGPRAQAAAAAPQRSSSRYQSTSGARLRLGRTGQAISRAASAASSTVRSRSASVWARLTNITS